MTRSPRFESLEQRRLLTIQIVAWNTFNNPNNSSRDESFRTVFEAMGAPDILALSETDNSQAGDNSIGRVEAILDSISTADYSHAVSSLDGGGDATGYVYNTSTISLIETFELSGFTHFPLRAKFRPAETSGDADFYMYTVHLKAGSSSFDRGRRLDEARIIRNDADSLGEGANIIVAGDFNMRASTESAYVELAASGPGRVNDVANALGNWHDNNAFRSLHSQDPRPNGGRMDDRFDLQLASDELYDRSGFEYVNGSFFVFGNNGTHTLNQGIQSGTGASPEVLAALVDASDHLPIVASYEVLGQDSNPPIPDTPDPDPPIPHSLPVDPPATFSNSVVISELMYNPASSESSPGVGEWVELVNAGITDVDLTGWSIDDEDSSDWGSIPTMSIPPGGTAVLFDEAFASESEFRSSWSIPSDVALAGISWGNLANSPSPTSEILALRDATGNEVDVVNYDDSGDWPSDNNAASIQLSDFNSDNNLGASWLISTLGVAGVKSPSGSPFSALDVGSPGLALGDLPTVEPEPEPQPEPPVDPPATGSTSFSVRGSGWGSASYIAAPEQVDDGETLPWTGIDTFQLEYEGDLPSFDAVELYRIEGQERTLIPSGLVSFGAGIVTYNLLGLDDVGLGSARYELDVIYPESTEKTQFNIVPGSASRDGVVNFFDFAAMARTFGSTTSDGETPLDADFNADGVVSFFDFAVLARNFGVDVRP